MLTAQLHFYCKSTAPVSKIFVESNYTQIIEKNDHEKSHEKHKIYCTNNFPTTARFDRSPTFSGGKFTTCNTSHGSIYIEQYVSSRIRAPAQILCQHCSNIHSTHSDSKQIPVNNEQFNGVFAFNFMMMQSN